MMPKQREPTSTTTVCMFYTSLKSCILHFAGGTNENIVKGQKMSDRNRLSLTFIHGILFHSALQYK